MGPPQANSGKRSDLHRQSRSLSDLTQYSLLHTYDAQMLKGLAFLEPDEDAFAVEYLLAADEGGVYFTL